MGGGRGALEPGSLSGWGAKAALLLFPEGRLPHYQCPALHAECPWHCLLAVRPPAAAGRPCPCPSMVPCSFLGGWVPSRGPGCPSLCSPGVTAGGCLLPFFSCAGQPSLSTQGMASGPGKASRPSLSAGQRLFERPQCGSCFPRSMASCPSCPCSFQSSGSWQPPVEKLGSWPR